MFEGKDNADRVAIAVEKEIDEEVHVEHAAEVAHIDEKQAPKSDVWAGVVFYANHMTDP